jgi:hypothetical protein
MAPFLPFDEFCLVVELLDALFDAVVTGGADEVTGGTEEVTGGLTVFVPRAAAGASGIARQMPTINVPENVRTGCPSIH